MPTSDASPFQFFPSSEYLKLPREPQPWVIKDIIPVGGLVNLYGLPKTGKSFLALGMALAIANGDDEWEGYEVRKHGAVAYLQIDTPREEWAERLNRLPLNDNLWIADMWNIIQYPANVLDGPTIAWLAEQMQRINPVVVFIDTLREAHNGDENDSTVMRNVITSLVGACRPAAIVLLSHQRKDGIAQAGFESDMMDQARGSSYVAGRMDVVMRLTQKRLTYKGRAVGQISVDVKQDPESLLIHIQHDEREISQLIEGLVNQHPQDSIHALALKLSGLKKISLSTATRRVKAWKENKANGK